jgi:outer membrane protein assembly factor BamB
MWRHDARRSAETDEALPDELHLRWTRKLPKLEPAWPGQAARGILTFDVSYKPVVTGKRMFVGSSRNHGVTAFDTDTGEELWRFYADGPVRFAPVAWRGKVYFASDDGHLYCLDAADGRRLWRFRGGPDGRKVIGNGHLVSLWPARGGPVVADGNVYFAASIWPFMGAFLYRIDAETGKLVWENSGIGADVWRRGASPWGRRVRPSIYGSVPQGYLAATVQPRGGRKLLVVPQGRNMPQVFDRRTGKLLFHDIVGMHPGDSRDQWFALTDGLRLFFGRPGAEYTRPYFHCVDLEQLKITDGNVCPTGVTGEKTLYQISADGRTLTGFRVGSLHRSWKLPLRPAARATCPGSYIKAGADLYAAGADGRVLVVKDVDSAKRRVAAGPRIIGGAVWDMLAADGKLFVVAADGSITCYGGRYARPKTHRTTTAGPSLSPAAAEVLAATGVTDGYCVVLGLDDGALAASLAAASALRVIAVDPDPARVADLRAKADAAGLYGERLSAYVGDLPASGLPPYLADLIVSETLDASVLLDVAAARAVFAALRPYGGTLCLARGTVDAQKVKAARAEMSRSGRYLLVTRTGAPPGAADRSHSNGDAANTMTSRDALVKPPFGVLWFGGAGNAEILPRHGHGPSPQVVRGRLFIEGRDILRAVDIYTGRLLWERRFPGWGAFFDTGSKQLGSHEIGDNYASAPDAVCVITPAQCLALDPATGQTIREFETPARVGEDANWGSVRILDDMLVAVLRPIREGKANAPNGPAGEWLAVFDRATGKALWTRRAEHAWPHTAVIAAGTPGAAGGRVFCADRFPIEALAPAMRRGLGRLQSSRGRPPSGKPKLYALEARTGRVVWSTDENLHGAWLSYSVEHDVIIQCGRGRLSGKAGDPRGFVALKGADGTLLWKTPSHDDRKDPASPMGPPMLARDMVLPQRGYARGIADGLPVSRPEPLTGAPFKWIMTPHACGITSASENLIMIRAGGGHAGFIDVRHGFGMNCLNGFRSSCTANMIPAGGVLTVPDYTRSCNCQFKNRSSVGLVHMPDAEHWAFDYTPPPVEGRVRRVGLNFGAPGDRVAEGGTLWLEAPGTGAPGPALDFAIGDPETRRPGGSFRMHSSRIASGPLRWVTASGITGAASVSVKVNGSGTYAVRLYFAEPDPDAAVGDRVFDVRLQGRDALKGFDVVEAAGGARRGVVRAVEGVRVKEVLELTLATVKGEPLICGLELVDNLENPRDSE